MFRMESDLERTYRQEIVARDSSVVSSVIRSILPPVYPLSLLTPSLPLSLLTP